MTKGGYYIPMHSTAEALEDLEKCSCKDPPGLGDTTKSGLW